MRFQGRMRPILGIGLENTYNSLIKNLVALFTLLENLGETEYKNN